MYESIASVYYKIAYVRVVPRTYAAAAIVNRNALCSRRRRRIVVTL